MSVFPRDDALVDRVTKYGHCFFWIMRLLQRCTKVKIKSVESIWIECGRNKAEDMITKFGTY